MPKEHFYKEDLIVEYATNDFVGFYLNADDEVEETRHCETLVGAQSELDKYNKIIAEIKAENEKGK